MNGTTIKHRGAFVATLLTGTFSMSISQSSLSTAYPAFMKAFGLGADTVAWLTTGFMLVMTLMIPVSPWLLHNVPFQRLFQAIELIFAVGTALCIWAPSFAVLMIGRLLEAVAVGIIFPSFQTVLLTITPHSERNSRLGNGIGAGGGPDYFRGLVDVVSMASVIPILPNCFSACTGSFDCHDYLGDAAGTDPVRLGFVYLVGELSDLAICFKCVVKTRPARRGD